MNENLTLLHVGCGELNIRHTPKGFQVGHWQELRLDIDKRHNADILGSITDMKSVADNSIDAIYSSQNIEHIFAHEVSEALNEFYRVLKPSGFAVISCPDIQALGEAISAGNITKPLYTSPQGPISALDILYGHRQSIRDGRHFMAHKTAFTNITLAAALRDVGFRTIGVKKVKDGQDSLWAVAFKSTTDQPILKHALDYYANRWRVGDALKNADAGYAPDQFDLGTLHEKGVILRRDNVHAYKWYSISHDGSKDAELRDMALKARDRVAENMTPAQIAEAQRLASAWKPTK